MGRLTDLFRDNKLFLTIIQSCLDYHNQLLAADHFDVMKRLLMNKNVIKTYDELTNYLKCPLKGKELLVSYCFARFPGEVMDIEDNPLQQMLQRTSKKLISRLTKMFITKQRCQLAYVNTYTNIYSDYYRVFMYNDKRQLLQLLLVQWHDFEVTKDNIQSSTRLSITEKRDIRLGLLENQRLLERHSKQLDPSFNLNLFLKYHNLHTKIDSCMRQAYWNRVNDAFTSLDKTFILDTVKDIKNILTTIRPCKNFKCELDSKINDDEISKILQGYLDHQPFMTIIEVIIDNIKSLQAPSRTPHMETEWQQVKKSADYATIIKFVYTELYEIIENIIVLGIIQNIN